ncbi:MAG: DUF2851 family protein, partial [Bacteroidia bacterium]
MSFGYNEDLLQFIWEFQLYQNDKLITTSGKEIRILKQGFLNNNSGPDFENCEVKIGSETFYGSIEIHIDSKDWEHHNHHLDPSYNNVVLHVCYSGNKTALRQDGTAIPTLYLENKIDDRALVKYKRLMEDKPFIPCQNQLSELSSFDVVIWVERMIVERLESRCHSYKKYLNQSNNHWNQAFFTAICRTFGMPVNSEAFEEIAAQLPFDIVQKHNKSLFQLEALFFGVSGLLQHNTEDNYCIGLQSEYAFLKKKYGLKEISTRVKLGRMRPMNLPHIKIAQLAALFHHIPQFISSVLSLPPTKEIQKLLDFQLSDYWSTHYSFGKASKPKSKKISAGFIDHLFLNAIVPFVFFYEKEKMTIDSNKAMEYLRALKSEKNSIISNW